jgi:hypothetical protein
VGLSVEFVAPTLTVEPGSVRGLEAHVRNEGPDACDLVFEVSGAAAGWSWVHPEACGLAPGDEATVGVFLKPLAGPVPFAGTHRFGLRAQCAAEPAQAASAEATVEVRPYTEVVAVLDPVHGRHQRACDYTLRLENQGNVGMRATLAADEDAGRELLLRVQPAEVSAGPGETVKATVHVEARKALKKGERRFPICVRANVEGAPQLRADGAFYQLGRKPG